MSNQRERKRENDSVCVREEEEEEEVNPLLLAFPFTPGDNATFHY